MRGSDVEIHLQVNDGNAPAQREHDAVSAAVQRVKAEEAELREKARVEERQRCVAIVNLLMGDPSNVTKKQLRAAITDMIMAPGSPAQWRIIPK
jgi:hypothetical protein